MTESEQNRLAIAGAMKQLLRTMPIEKITTDRILEIAGVSRRSFYRYFKDKYELLEWIYNYDFCRFVEVRQEKSIWEYYPDILRSLRADPETARFVIRRYVYAFFDGYIWWLKKKEPMSAEEFETLSKGIAKATADAVLRSFAKSDDYRQALSGAES